MVLVIFTLVKKFLMKSSITTSLSIVLGEVAELPRVAAAV